MKPAAFLGSDQVRRGQSQPRNDYVWFVWMKLLRAASLAQLRVDLAFLSQSRTEDSPVLFRLGKWCFNHGISFRDKRFGKGLNLARITKAAIPTRTGKYSLCDS